MSRTIFAALAAAASLSWSTAAMAQGWGPPPPGVPVQPQTAPEETQVTQEQPDEQSEPPPAPQPQPEEAQTTPPVPQGPQAEAAEPTAEVETEEGEEAQQGEGEEQAEEGDQRRGRWLRRLLERLEFHGYARMPLNLHFRPTHRDETSSGEEGGDEGTRMRVRSPFLVDNDYYLSGFAYTRLAETDWSELFLTGHLTDHVSVTVGMFASLYSDWAYTSVDRQFGIAQASITWQGVGGVEPLMLKAGVFWDRLGYIQPYDTYVFGRTHQLGLQLGWDFPNEAQIRVGFGAHLEVLQQNQGFTPLVYLYGGSPLGRLPITVNLYLVGLWTSDIRPLTTMEEGHLVVFGGDLKIDFPWFDGPLYIALAGYWAENALFLANVFELLHSTGGRGLTENYFGIQNSDNGTGSIISGAVDWPIAWRGLRLHFFGMLAHVTSDARAEADPAFADGRTYLKWGLEPGYQFLDWLRLSIRYDRVILDMHHPAQAFRVLSPQLTFTAWRGIDVILAYSHYFYDEDEFGNHVELRPNQIPGVTMPDEDVFRIMARAEW